MGTVKRDRMRAAQEAVGCPYCGVAKGYPCLTRGDRVYREVHEARVQLAKAKKEAEAKGDQPEARAVVRRVWGI